MEALCFSHLRWDFVYQRPQHLLTRFAKSAPVHFWEEPIYEDRPKPELQRTSKNNGVTVLTPLLPQGLSGEATTEIQRELLNFYLREQKIVAFAAWYYTPMALLFSGHLQPLVTIYDCMDELSAFQGAPPELIDLEKQLFQNADVVFVGGASLFESKRLQHKNIHLFPSSIDHEHFSEARRHHEDPADQRDIPHPRIGFYGVLDERLDRDLLRDVAQAHAEWHFVLIGPVVKIREEDLPRSPNQHYLGPKSYNELPTYLANWDVAMLPFARNASTRFISPTKTPEYLAGGKPVVSTPIADVVKPYGELGLVKIGSDTQTFAEAINQCLRESKEDWMKQVDRFLAGNSWDKTFQQMWEEIQQVRCRIPASSAAA